MMKISKQLFSVVICTHNPNQEVLAETIEAIESQEAAEFDFELIIVDNASEIPLHSLPVLVGKPKCRTVWEPNLGLTSARLRGFTEAKNELIVLVDDDNILASDYLKNAAKIAADYPWLGAFGGQISPRFATPPPEYLISRLRMLATNSVETANYALLKDFSVLKCSPVGAGMVLRREVASSYSKSLNDDKTRLNLDRKGGTLTSGGDNDICLFCQDIGYGTGLFPELKLEHIIPSERLTLPYFLRLAEGMAYSHSILYEIWQRRWNLQQSNRTTSSLDHLVDHYKNLRWFFKMLLNTNSPEHQLLNAEKKGIRRAKSTIKSWDRIPNLSPD